MTSESLDEARERLQHLVIACEANRQDEPMALMPGKLTHDIRQLLADNELLADREAAIATLMAKVAVLEADLAESRRDRDEWEKLYDAADEAAAKALAKVAALEAALAAKDALIKDMGRDRERLRTALEQAQADAAAMRQAVSNAVHMLRFADGLHDHQLIGLEKAIQHTAGQALLDELAALRAKVARLASTRRKPDRTRNSHP